LRKQKRPGRPRGWGGQMLKMTRGVEGNTSKLRNGFY
jgi:hypothetical protein